jgi:hypothetical protein
MHVEATVEDIVVSVVIIEWQIVLWRLAVAALAVITAPLAQASIAVLKGPWLDLLLLLPRLLLLRFLLGPGEEELQGPWLDLVERGALRRWPWNSVRPSNACN